MAQRIKGQEVEVLLVVDGAPKTSVTAIKSFEVEFQLDILTEGYLGETSSRRDEIFNGVSGSLEFDLESGDLLDIAQQIIDRARRRTPGTVINVKAALNFPSGEIRRIVIKDAFFSAIPVSFGGRDEYGSLTLDFEAQDYSFL